MRKIDIAIEVIRVAGCFAIALIVSFLLSSCTETFEWTLECDGNGCEGEVQE